MVIIAVILLFILQAFSPAMAQVQVAAPTGSSVPAEAVSVSSGDDFNSHYKVGPADVLEIRVHDEEDLSGEFIVLDTGNIDMPPVGNIEVQGLTVYEISELLEKLLKDGYLNDPHVSTQVFSFASQPVEVMGAVKEPGVYYLMGETTLVEMLAKAGGVVSEKSIKEIHVTRIGSADGEPIIVNLTQLMAYGQGNMVLQAGDVINVPEGLFVYVAGQVQEPGPVTYQDGLTVLQALTAAGGQSTTAKLRDAYILRGGERILVNLKRIIQGRDPDVIMQPEDQLYVQESMF